jgi:hypothetical protein
LATTRCLLMAAVLLAGCTQGYQVATPTAESGPVAAPPASTPPPARGLGRVVPTDRLSVMRAVHTATLLTSGQVLVAGGCTAHSCEMDESGATAELFDPAVGAFTRVGNMTTTRSGHTATRLPSGLVLIAGGWSRGGVVASAELYDPATRTFAASGSLREARGGATATPLPDGTVLITGGSANGRLLASAEVYSPGTGTFSPTGSLAVPRGGHAAALLPDGHVLITGGSSGRGAVLASAEIYDPATGIFARTGDMTVVRHKHAAVALRDGTLLIVGGSDMRDSRGQYASVEVYDPKGGGFAATAAMSAARYKLPDAVVPLRTGEVLIAGGDEQVEVYDPVARAFRTGAGSLGSPWSFATATLLPDGAVLIAGGYDPRINLTAGAWLYRHDA